MIWTEEMKETLRKFADFENFSYTDIAKMMSAEYGVTFTKGSVVGMARRIGVPRRPSPIKPVIVKPVIVKPVTIKQDNPVTIYDLEWGMCKWPLGKPYDRPPFTYCGKETEDANGSWCEAHRKRAFNSRL